jgi:hypothetical protein
MILGLKLRGLDDLVGVLHVLLSAFDQLKRAETENELKEN